MARPEVKADIALDVRLNQVATTDESRQAYDAVYDAEGLTQPESFYIWLLKLMQLRPMETYLDISCGRGELIEYAQRTGIRSVHGLDLSFNALAFRHAQSPTQRLTTANSQIMPYRDDSFDVISNIGSLEHYVDMAAAVREMARVLKQTGRAYVLVPNTFSLLNNIWIAYRQGYTSYDPYQPIQRYMARIEWHELLEENGLQVMETLGYERPRPYTVRDFWVNYVNRPKEIARWLLSPFIPLNLAFCFVFVCHKA